MNQKKNVFALIAGICLMAASFLMFISTARNMVLSIQYHSLNYSTFVAFFLEIALLLAGLFLLLRKKLVAAIMMCVVAFLYLVNVVTGLTFWLVCIFFAYGLLGAALFGKGIYGLIMCLGAAFFRFIPFVRQLVNFPRSFGYGGISALMSTLSLLSVMLMITAMVMAGLYLLDRKSVV